MAWNIRSGGGRRIAGIGAQLARWRPDVAVLSEFRATPPSRSLAETLHGRGLVHQRTTARADRPTTNALLLASRWPLRRIPRRQAPGESDRWLLARVEAPVPFALGGMHVPCATSGRKYVFHDGVLAVARAWSAGPALLVGDTNTGRPGLDEEAPVFGPREEAWIDALEASGWSDAFRRLRPRGRAYTWYSPNAGNGFRLDQAFVNREAVAALRAVRHAWGASRPRGGRRDALSDHAALLVDLDVTRLARPGYPAAS